MNNTAILCIDADDDDQLFVRRALAELNVDHPVVSLSDGQAALDYLHTSSEPLFMILSEIRLPGLNGLELRRYIEQDAALRTKSIPFIFMTAPVEEHLVKEAYELTIQGLFEKKESFDELKAQLYRIIDYWEDCLHPKRFTA